LLVTRLIYGISISLRKKINIFIVGRLSAKEKEYFKGIKIIPKWCVKKIKNPILLTGFHPIVNVIDFEKNSKNFIEIYHPLSRFEPRNLAQLMEFYLHEDSILFDKKLLEYKMIRYDNLFNSMSDEEIDKNKIFNCYKLKGNEEDFNLYDDIVKKSANGDIIVYIINDNIDFVQNNLGRYVDYRNYPCKYNIFTETEWNNFKRTIEYKEFS